jgi:hypothetical protein
MHLLVAGYFAARHYLYFVVFPHPCISIQIIPQSRDLYDFRIVQSVCVLSVINFIACWVAQASASQVR